MPQVKDQVQQEPTKSRKRQPVSVLNKVTIVALCGVALAVTANLLIVWLLHGVFVPEFFIVILPALLMVGLVIRHVRWSPAAGAALALLTASLFLTDPNAQYTLSHPGNGLIDFIAEVSVLAFTLIAVVTGIGATIQNYRGSQPSRQWWLQPFLTGLAGIVVGMFIVATLAAVNPVATGTSSSKDGESTVYMTVNNFAQNVVLVPKGSRLLIVNETSVEHMLQNGMWTPNGTQETLTGPGAPTVHNLKITGGSVQIGPFTTAGVFHLYCTIHRGMNQTIVVQ